MVNPHSEGFPPPPWRLRGTVWAGVLRAAPGPVPGLPPGLIPILPQYLAVAAIRYRGGSLRYNEFVCGSLARRGHRLGLHIREIWVDHRGSRRGGLLIWGLPKRLADFDWTTDRVRVTDDRGVRVTLAVHPRIASIIPVLIPVPFFGNLGGRLLFTTATLRAMAAPATLRVVDWPDDWPVLTTGASALSVVAPDSGMSFPASRAVSDL